MAKASAGGRSQRKPGPVFAVPPDLPRSDRRKVQDIIDAQWRESTGRKPHQPTPFRFRFQLVPLAWLAGACAGLVSRAGHAYLITCIAAALAVLVTVVATRDRKPFPRWHTQGMAAWASAWALILMWHGLGPWAAAGLAGWAVPSAFWVHRYAWHPAAAQARPDTSVEDTWKQLAATQKWDAFLGPKRVIPGGAQWPIVCNGATTHIEKIVPRRNEVAAAYDKAITEAYTEPDPSGIQSRGWLTLLSGSGSLSQPRAWDGAGIDPATGLAVVGRFPDGKPVRERYFVPGVGGGVRHTIIAGADGTGKTGLIDMGLAISAASGLIAPVILDPQEGQALPAWRNQVPYACGADECMTYLRGLHAAMFARSACLAGLMWVHPKSGRPVKGMGFFDPFMTGLPIIEITIDEAPVLLALKGAAALVLDIAKLGRKVGFRLRLAAQVPSINEMGKSELRSILVGGNVFCFRTGDKVTSGMTNIPSNPHQLPKYWPDGRTTVGLGFAETIEARPSVTMRTDWIEDPYSFAEETQVRPPDGDVAAYLARSIASGDADLAGLAGQAATAAAIQLQMLRMLQRPMSMGQLISGCEFAVSTVVDAMTELEQAGKVRQAGDLFEATP